jgi:hypothetical protein
VFGWCVTCLEQSGCVEIDVAPRCRRASTRLDLRARPRRFRPVRRAGPIDDRRQVVAAVALVLSLWGLALALVGLSLYARPATDPPSPMGNGTPALLTFGGLSTAILGLSLCVVIYAPLLRRFVSPFQAVQFGGLMAAVVTLILGALNYNPRRNLAVVVGVALGLSVSTAARLAEIRGREKVRARGEPL